MTTFLLVLFIGSTPDPLPVVPDPLPVKVNHSVAVNKMVRAAPAVAAARTFQFDPDHTCDTCGRQQFYISGPGPQIGRHAHTCWYCRTSWWHEP